VPYVAHPFRVRETGAMHEIVIGPAAAASAKGQVEHILKAHGLPSVRITRSNIPHRS
jgi:hypothetical protein